MAADGKIVKCILDEAIILEAFGLEQRARALPDEHGKKKA